MYKPNDIEILEAYDDYLENMPDEAGSISGSAIWSEAFKRGMRFNPNVTEPGHTPDHEQSEVYCHECSKAGGADMPIYHLPPACSGR